MGASQRFEIFGVTDVGRKRSHNEDSIGSDPELGLAVLADGMGGYKAGEVASAIAVDMILKELREALKDVTPGEIDAQTGFSYETMLVKAAIDKANATIYATAQTQPQCQGMGTTVVAAAFYDERMTIAHVGDSRLYRMRNERLEQVTSDHSLLQELIDKGFYTPEEAKHSLNKNLVTRAMGIDPRVQADLQEEMISPGDLYMLCSDGLSDFVEDPQIETTLREYSGDLAQAANTLVEQANAAGGKDNISVILAKAPRSPKSKRRWYNRMFDWF